MPLPPGSMSRRDDLDVVSAHVEKGSGNHFAVRELPDFGLGPGDEVLRLDHVACHPRAGHKLDVTLDAVRSGQDGYFRLVRIRHVLAPGCIRSDHYCNACASRRDAAL